MHPRALLESEFMARRQRNSGYSLRAFAKFLDLPSGRLSQLLSEKRRFTPKLTQKIAARLNLDPEKTDKLLHAVAPQKSAPGATYQPIAMDEFLVISDPVHFSLLSLLELDKFTGTPKAAADRLGISVVEARGALKRLKRVGLVEESAGIFVLSRQEARATSSDVNFAALRECHKRLLAESAELIDAVPIQLRDISSITMAIDAKKIPEAKKRIRDFRRSMSEFLESGRKEEVYRINIQLVPVTRKRDS